MKSRMFPVLAIATTLISGVAPAKAALNIKGSDTVLPLSQALAESYNNKDAKADVVVTGGGSTLGISSLINGTTNLATASRPLSPKEFASAKARGFVPMVHRIAKYGLTVIVHKSNPVKSLTMDQLAGIYSGGITNWNQVGGPNLRITVTGRDSSSGTYGFFKDTLFPGRPYRSDMLTLASTNTIAIAVSRDESAIGYIGIAYWEKWKSKVKDLLIAPKKGAAPVEPTPETVSNGTYPLFRYLFIVSRGKPSGEQAKFIKYAQSAEGQAIVQKVGYVPIR